MSLGHRSYVCPRAAGGGGASRPAPPRVSVWRQIAPASESTGAPTPHPPPVDWVRQESLGQRQEAGQNPGTGRRRRRRRRRPRNCRPSDRARPESAPADGPQRVVVPAEAPLDPCIFCCTERFARAEADLSMAVVISIIGAAAAVEEVAAVVASKMDVGDGSLVLRRASPTSFLLFLPDMAAGERAGSGSARQRRRPRSPSPAAGSGLGGGGDPARRPVWDRLGPTAGGGSHVAEASPSDVDAWETHEGARESPASGSRPFGGASPVAEGIDFDSALDAAATSCSCTSGYDAGDPPMDSLLTAPPASGDDVTPSVNSPTLVRFDGFTTHGGLVNAS
ncbi:hypothetical protein E2562_033677 [Oryza meyeriana var. granulata]|uniref:Uncharacterized protein n=1 Tax=Oryza meyeriana var. granulata TaxID=110450 RepID=A0A6G1E5Y0_9ORYZ|nr:hypothetical protein E2562_033677 [Oryza meyeriana var. granulata]